MAVLIRLNIAPESKKQSTFCPARLNCWRKYNGVPLLALTRVFAISSFFKSKYVLVPSTVSNNLEFSLPLYSFSVIVGRPGLPECFVLVSFLNTPPSLVLTLLA